MSDTAQYVPTVTDVETRKGIADLLAQGKVDDATVLTFDAKESQARILGSVALHLHLLSTGTEQKAYAASHGISEATVTRRNMVGRMLVKAGADNYTAPLGDAAYRMTTTPGADSQKRRDALMEKASLALGIPSDTKDGADYARLLIEAARIVTAQTSAERATEKEKAAADKAAVEAAKVAAEEEAAKPVTVTTLIASARSVLSPVVRAIEAGTIEPDDLVAFGDFLTEYAAVTRALMVSRGMDTAKPAPKPAAPRKAVASK